MKIKNKKALIFSFGLLFTLILAMVRIFFLVQTTLGTLNEDSGYSIGSNQMEVYEAIYDSERSQLYGDEGFSLALQQSIYETAVTGWGSRSTACGKLGQVSIWRRNSATKCYPDFDDIKADIAKRTLESLKQKYLSSNPYSDLKGTEKIEYEIFFEQKGTKLITRAYPINPAIERVVCNYGKPPLFVFDAVFKPSVFGYAIPGTPSFGGKINIPDLFADDITGTCGLYAYRPAFRKELDFSITDFKEASEQAEQLSGEIEDCEKKGDVLNKCVTEKLKNYPKLSKDCISMSARADRAFLLCYNTNKKIVAAHTNDNKLGIKNLNIAFVLYFPKEAII